MIRFWSAVIVALTMSAAQAGPVDDARLDYIAGQYERALEVLLPAAEAGDTNAQNIVGDAYDTGNGVPLDHAAARRWWEKAAQQGFSKAQYNLGLMLSVGREGLDPDYVEAERWFQAAADQGNGDAFNELGLLYAYGRGREVDAARAVEFYRQGHALGSAIAASNLGSAYATGEGLEQDYAQAFAYISAAAAQGERQAIHNLAVLYRDGLHVFQDETAAFLLFLEAQQLGYPKAGHQVADMMLQDDRWWSDPVGALAYCVWAVDSGGSPEELFLDCDEVAADLSEAEKAEALLWASTL